MNALRILVVAALAFAGTLSSPAQAHCDTLDGPVVGAARLALGSGNVAPALAWVRKEDETRVREAFAKAGKARRAGAPADGESDRAFYATLVRLHREGEGERFTGLKPAGTIEPQVAAADAALASGSAERLERLLVDDTLAGLRRRFDAAVRLRGYDPADVEAGRAFVAAYVDFVHHVERLHASAAAGAHAHAAVGPNSARQAVAVPRVREHTAPPAHAH